MHSPPPFVRISAARRLLEVTTRTDSAGRYLLCGLPAGHIDGLEAAKQGYQNQVNNVSVNPGTDAVVDIEMIKQK